MQEPFNIFQQWFQLAKDAEILEPNAMTLATANHAGKPSARIVLLKDFDENGFVFYTNLSSRKSCEIEENPNVALCFLWRQIGKQIRIEGAAEIVSPQEADDYFATRPRLSQIGAWASEQSQLLNQREELLNRVAELEKKYENQQIPRPDFWSGWRVVPHRIEFWQEEEFRLHTRQVYELRNNSWTKFMLFP